MLQSVLFVAMGGALGSVARYLVALAAAGLIGSAYPWGTFIANILGCFLMGLVASYFIATPDQTQMRLLLTTGFLGGFTTFSTFSLDVYKLSQDGFTGLAVTYLALSVVLSLLALVMGFMLMQRLS